MEVFIKKENNTHKVNWFSSIPEKYRKEIITRIKAKAKDQSPQKILNDFQVILNIASSGHSKKLRRSIPLERTSYYEGTEERKGLKMKSDSMNTTSASLFLSSPLQNPAAHKPSIGKEIVYQFPQQYESKFKHQPKFYSKFGELKRAESALNTKQAQQAIESLPPDLLELYYTICNEQSGNEEMLEGKDDKKILNLNHQLKKIKKGSDTVYQNPAKLIQLIKSKKDPLRSSYSVKYLGITEGRIGILSRRLPIPTVNRRARKNISPYEKVITPKKLRNIKSESQLKTKIRQQIDNFIEEENFQFGEFEENNEASIEDNLNISNSIPPKQPTPQNQSFHIPKEEEPPEDDREYQIIQTTDLDSIPFQTESSIKQRVAKTEESESNIQQKTQDGPKVSESYSGVRSKSIDKNRKNKDIKEIIVENKDSKLKKKKRTNQKRNKKHNRITSLRNDESDSRALPSIEKEPSSSTTSFPKIPNPKQIKVKTLKKTKSKENPIQQFNKNEKNIISKKPSLPDLGTKIKSKLSPVGSSTPGTLFPKSHTENESYPSSKAFPSAVTGEEGGEGIVTPMQDYASVRSSEIDRFNSGKLRDTQKEILGEKNIDDYLNEYKEEEEEEIFRSQVQDEEISYLQEVDPQTEYKTNISQNPKAQDTDAESSFLMPHPERYDKYLIHTYSLPKGLVAGKKIPVLSESEKIFLDKYSKQNIDLLMLQREIVNIRQNRGFKGQKLQPLRKNIFLGNTTLGGKGFHFRKATTPIPGKLTGLQSRTGGKVTPMAHPKTASFAIKNPEKSVNPIQKFVPPPISENVHLDKQISSSSKEKPSLDNQTSNEPQPNQKSDKNEINQKRLKKMTEQDQYRSVGGNIAKPSNWGSTASSEFILENSLLKQKQKQLIETDFDKREKILLEKLEKREISPNADIEKNNLLIKQLLEEKNTRKKKNQSDDIHQFAQQMNSPNIVGPEEESLVEDKKDHNKYQDLNSQMLDDEFYSDTQSNHRREIQESGIDEVDADANKFLDMLNKFSQSSSSEIYLKYLQYKKFKKEMEEKDLLRILTENHIK